MQGQEKWIHTEHEACSNGREEFLFTKQFCELASNGKRQKRVRTPTSFDE